MTRLSRNAGEAEARAARPGEGLFLVLLLAACGNEPQKPVVEGDQPAAPTCTSPADCAFGERCVDSACSSEVAPPLTDTGCLSDADCSPGTLCALATGLCVAQVESPVVEPDAAADCDEGTARPCGSKVGQCEYGTQGCVDGAWGACAGGNGAIFEVCNGLDDDCDGVIPEDELDPDGDGVPACGGDCAPLDPEAAPGLDELCDGKDNDCDALTDEGTDALCDDGILCNGAESCGGGECVPGTPVFCGDLDGPCEIGQCVEASGTCEATKRSDGTACNDGLSCTTGTTCSAGACAGGAPLDCTAAGDACNDGVCVEGEGCAASPKQNGTACDEVFFCLVGETCDGGTCQGGTPRDCGAAGGCADGGTCDEAQNACTGGTPVNEGLLCDDGVFCTEVSTCTAGACTGGTPRDCSTVADNCNQGTCNEADLRCDKDPLDDGTGCDDGSFCTTGDLCTAGLCGGEARDCSGAGDTCNRGTCNEALNGCEPTPEADGTPCPDALYCSVSEACVAGDCTTQPRNCNAAGDACNNPACDEAGDACVADPKPNGTLCEDAAFCTAADSCQGGSCTPGGPRDCSGVADDCHEGACNEAQNICEAVDNGQCTCDPGLDDDFDGSNACNDCDDSNGARHPGAAERCNGLDDDCDGEADEDFDGDHDNYAVCATNPLLFDCDDDEPFTNPGAPERCGPSLTGNGVDDNCNGYIDEGCEPCNAADTDGDGVSQCQGDCAPSDGERFPSNAEICDGADNDCNVYTVDNCGVSDPCNWPSGEDICEEGLLCGCVLNNAGNCLNDYVCTALCNTSVTGPTGDGCAGDETCFYDLQRSANVHGCGVVDFVPGTKVGGVACNADSECRSGNCERLFTGPGQKDYCLDYCGSDAYCTAGGTACRLLVGGSVDGFCWPSSRLGTGAVGATCTSSSSCDHGLCANVAGNRYCTEPCCSDSDCSSGFTCALTGDALPTAYAYVEPGAPACTTTPQCPAGLVCTTGGECAWPLVDTSPMCVRDLSGQGTRPAGAACTSNTDCKSAFCEDALGVCLEICCSDATCPAGSSCELLVVEAQPGKATSARVCVNQSTDEVLERR